jgi:hypothetical protein
MQIKQFVDENAQHHGIFIDGKLAPDRRSGLLSSSFRSVHVAEYEGRTLLSVYPNADWSQPIGSGVFEVTKLA